MTKKPETKTERLLTQILAAVNALKPGEPVQVTQHIHNPVQRPIADNPEVPVRLHTLRYAATMLEAQEDKGDRYCAQQIREAITFWMAEDKRRRVFDRPPQAKTSQIALDEIAARQKGFEEGYRQAQFADFETASVQVLHDHEREGLKTDPAWGAAAVMNKINQQLGEPVPDRNEWVLNRLTRVDARRKLTDYGKAQQERVAQQRREFNEELSRHIAKGFDVALPAEDDMGHPQEGQNYTAPIGAPLHPHVPEGPVDKGDGRTFWQDAKDFRDRQIALEEAAQAVDKIRRIEALMELPVVNKLPAIRRILKGEDDGPAE